MKGRRLALPWSADRDVTEGKQNAKGEEKTGDMVLWCAGNYNSSFPLTILYYGYYLHRVLHRFLFLLAASHLLGGS